MATLNPSIPAHGSYDGGTNVLTDYGGRLRRARLALAILLVPIVMLFVSFTSAYIVRQGLPTLDEHSGQYVRDWVSIHLPVPLLLVNTLLLLISTFTMEMARRQMARRTVLSPVERIPGITVGEEKRFPWLAVTAVLGFGFLAGQWTAWRELARGGVYLATNASSSFIYLMTVAHAVHLFGGIIALTTAFVLSLGRERLERQYIIVDTASWYWHFMALLWVYIFALLQFAK
jgi:cytochrome c oxidase subunit III